MYRTDRNNAICFENLEKALAKDPETYGCIDLLCAGWPCQDNSKAGKRKGLKGSKSSRWYEVRRLIRIFRPKWFVGENVPGLFSVNSGKDFWSIISDLDSLGYCVAWDVLDSRNFGVAQRRKRIFIVGSFGNIGASKILFKPESNNRHTEKIKKKKHDQYSLSLSTRYRGSGDAETCIFHPTVRTIQAEKHGKNSTSNIIASINTNRKRKTPGVSKRLDTVRGVVLGNAVTVNIAEWIGERIIKYERDNAIKNQDV